MVIVPVPSLCVSILVRIYAWNALSLGHQLIGLGQVCEEILSFFSVCCEFLNVAIEFGIELINVIFVFHNQNMRFGDLET